MIWRPWSLRKWFLMFLLVISLGLLCCLEYLRKTSYRNQGLAFYTSSNEIPFRVYFIYSFVPTILATLFATLWSFIDLDVKRLEPYSRISKDRVFSYADLFLDYAFELIFLVPFKALKRRHWTVVLTSTVYFFILILFVPIQSAILGLTTTDVTSETHLQSWPELIPVQYQYLKITSESVNLAHAVLVNNASWPIFTNSEYAVSPFEIQEHERARNRSWTAKARVYGAEPSCIDLPNFKKLFTDSDSVTADFQYFPFYSTISLAWNINLSGDKNTSTICPLEQEFVIQNPPNGTSIWQYWTAVSSNKPTPTGEELSTMATPDSLTQDKRNCTGFPFIATILGLSNRPSEKLGTQFYHAASKQASSQEFGSQTARLSLPKYTSTFDNDVSPMINPDIVVGYSSLIQNIFNVTVSGFACKPTYFSDTALVTFNEDYSISKVEFVYPGERKILNESQLDIPYLEKSIAPMYYSNTNSSIDSKMSKTNPNDAFFDTSYMSESLGTILQELVRQGRSDKNITAAKESIEKLYKSVSAINFAKLWDKSGGSIQVAANHTEYALVAVSVNQLFASASEAILALSAVACFVLIFTPIDTSMLRSDPESLASMATLMASYFSDTDSLAQLNSYLCTTDTRTLRNRTSHLICQWTNHSERRTLQIYGSKEHDQKPGINHLWTFERPFYLRAPGFFASALVFVLFISILAIIIWLGFNTLFTFLADTNSFEAQLFWQFLPSFAAVLVGAGWDLVYRDLSIKEPWVNLQRRSLPINSLSIGYASRPASATICKSFKRKHYFIGFVSYVCASTSLLSIAMGGSFVQSFTTALQSTSLTRRFHELDMSFQADPKTGATTGNDHDMKQAFNLVRTIVADGTPLFPWMSNSSFFVPLYTLDSTPLPNKIFKASTVGISASLDCTPLGSTHHSIQENQTIYGAWTWNLTRGGETLSREWKYNFPYFNQSFNSNFDIAGASSQGCVPTNQSRYCPDVGPPHDCVFSGPSPASITTYSSSFSHASNCSKTSVIVSETRESGREFSSLFCRPQVAMNTFDIKFDSSGIIKNSTNPGWRDSEFSSAEKMNAHLFKFNNELNQFIFNSENKELPYDWPGLLTARIRLKSHPSGEQSDAILAEAASQMYSHLFNAYWALYYNKWLLSDSNGASTKNSAFVSYRTARMIPSIPAFSVSFILLTLYLATAVLVYINRSHVPTPRMPKSIGSILPWMMHSRMMKDFKDTAHLTAKQRDDYLSKLNKEYQFGWFVDINGEWRLGVEESKYIKRAWDSNNPMPFTEVI